MISRYPFFLLALIEKDDRLRPKVSIPVLVNSNITVRVSGRLDWSFNGSKDTAADAISL